MKNQNKLYFENESSGRILFLLLIYTNLVNVFNLVFNKVSNESCWSTAKNTYMEPSPDPLYTILFDFP